MRTPDDVEATRLGLVVRDLNDEERASLEVADQGVVVSKVSNGPAERAGIREGDLILMLNNRKVANSADFERLAAELVQGKAVSLLVQRQGNPIFLALKRSSVSVCRCRRVCYHHGPDGRLGLVGSVTSGRLLGALFRVGIGDPPS